MKRQVKLRWEQKLASRTQTTANHEKAWLGMTSLLVNDDGPHYHELRNPNKVVGVLTSSAHASFFCPCLLGSVIKVISV